MRFESRLLQATCFESHKIKNTRYNGRKNMKDEIGNMKVEDLSWSLFHISSFRFHISATGDGQ